jgi:hypothetical protein
MMIWKYLTERDAKELTAWTNDQLDSEPRIVGDYIFWPWLTASDREWIIHDGNPPSPDKRGRPRDDKVWEAARDVRLIRQLWKRHKKVLDGKFRHSQHRTGTITVTAEKIAADRWGVDDVDAVCNRLHKKA